MTAQVDQIRQVADAVGVAPQEELLDDVRRIHAFLSGPLAAHARAEEEVLYPAVGRALGALDATRTMVRDHIRLRELTAELSGLLPSGADTLDAAHTIDLRRVLYSLHALVSVHLMKEEEVYLPILDSHLDVDEVLVLHQEMERIAHS